MIKYTNLLVAGFLTFFCFQVYNQVTLPRLVSDGMVLQRNTDVKIWGWAAPGEKEQVQFLKNIFYRKPQRAVN